ncbi:ribosome recycling factor [Helicobacter aurati]|uniref:Ribosome-recycling factor n=1 Tax=Helicobacter aurati TaxID=137778 RepID=A0A3D8J618_9HELI|nr:ribosome recycling factor [Helicobacter aurati]RDU72898.1 ribosome recycling factor [Helicobacter aurati]
MLQNIYKDTKDSMQKSLNALQRDFTTLRSNRVSVSLLDNIRIDYYGTLTPLSQVATILIQDSNTIIITPWEKPLTKNIEKAIQEANIGVNPNTNADSVKLFFPPMTSEQRKEIAKQARTMGEKTKVAIRNVRQDSNNAIKKLEKDKTITIDESKKSIDEIQKITDEYNKKIESMVKAKEEEILKI